MTFASPMVLDRSERTPYAAEISRARTAWLPQPLTDHNDNKTAAKSNSEAGLIATPRSGRWTRPLRVIAAKRYCLIRRYVTFTPQTAA